MTAPTEEWGCRAEHAVEAVRFLTGKFGHPPNYNMLSLATTLPWGVLNCGAIEAALRDGLLVEADRLPDGRSAAFGGCKTVFMPAEGAS
jgi:hypothetical protein